jgi:alpha-amylase/alpha-mannosidase (GH57 family)
VSTKAASTGAPLKVVLCWHMHQPEYRNYADDGWQLPWTYLHAIKDYVDMAAIIEQTPGARAVINFVPILLDQIEDYAGRVRRFLESGEPIGDLLLAALGAEAMPVGHDERAQLIRACLRANESRIINRFAPYRSLADFAELVRDDSDNLDYLDDQYIADIVTWYHLAWLGETVRRQDKRVMALIDKKRFYTAYDRRQLLKIVGELLSSVIGRYRRLAEAGRIELSMTPYAHPMLPLLLDFDAAREAVPDLPLPAAPGYPGGLERADWHMKQGIETFTRHFGFAPAGCWPAEGGVSSDTVRLMGKYGIRWTATGESVLRNSLAQSESTRAQPMETLLHCVYQIEEDAPALYFRDDGLSDLIGFTYYNWHGDDAVANMIHHLENIAQDLKDDMGRIVSIVLDGENAWEAYPDNGYHFLTALYRRLAEHPGFDLTTFADCLVNGTRICDLQKLVAGSWVYGTFSTWMGNEDKNRGWELLCEAKQAFDRVMDGGSLDAQSRERAIRQLAVCEGSDWCWWFGDYNPSDSVGDFERLYRLHLSNLYHFLGEEPPPSLREVISHGGGRPEQGGVMRRGQAESQ